MACRAPKRGFDALTVVSQTIEHVELGTAVVPTYPRHPLVLAGQARTVAFAINGPLTLGVGLSHQPILAALGLKAGLKDDKPIRHLRDYLAVLVPLLTAGSVDYSGPTVECSAQLFDREHSPVPVVVAALGPQALRAAGARTAGTAGTSLAWVGPAPDGCEPHRADYHERSRRRGARRSTHHCHPADLCNRRCRNHTSPDQ